MSRLYRILFAVLPFPRNEWIRAHHAELEYVEGRWQQRRWALGLVLLTGSALTSQLRHDASTFLGGVLMKTLVATLSILNFVAGVSLLALYIIETSPPLVVLALSGALLIQSGFTMALLLGAFGPHQDTGRHLQLSGSSLALIVGAAGFVIGFLANINPANNDPEYGPMTIALLIAAHGMASLLAFTPHRPVKAQLSTP
jgi:hypothetical protein